MVLFQQRSRELARQRAGDSTINHARNLHGPLRLTRQILAAFGFTLALGMLPAAQAQTLAEFRAGCGSCHGGAATAVPNGPNFNAAGSLTIFNRTITRGISPNGSPNLSNSVTYIHSVRPDIGSVSRPSVHAGP